MDYLTLMVEGELQFQQVGGAGSPVFIAVAGAIQRRFLPQHGRLADRVQHPQLADPPHEPRRQRRDELAERLDILRGLADNPDLRIRLDRAFRW